MFVKTWRLIKLVKISLVLGYSLSNYGNKTGIKMLFILYQDTIGGICCCFMNIYMIYRFPFVH